MADNGGAAYERHLNFEALFVTIYIDKPILQGGSNFDFNYSV